jgi:hypothetical protein
MIFNSVILEVAIGLFLVFFLVAMLSSGLNEIAAAMANLRASFLRKGIASIFDDNAELVDSFYNSYLIQGLSRRKGDPSYIPSDVFARVLRDLITPGSKGLPPRTWDEVLKKLSDANSEKLLSPIEREMVGVLKTAGIDQNKIDTLKTLTDQLETARQNLSKLVAEGAGSDTAAGLFLTRQVELLEKSVQEAETTVKDALERAQTNVETYFDEVMKRVNGWYKRRVQWISFIMALLVTLLLNIDTLAITNTLMTAPVVRATLIDAATAEVQGETQQAATFQDIDALMQAGLPLGWNPCTAPGFLIRDQTAAASCAQSIAQRSTWLWLFSKLAGLALTVVAGALGAPFWFDLLNKAVSLRLSGGKPEEKPAPKQ